MTCNNTATISHIPLLDNTLKITPVELGSESLDHKDWAASMELQDGVTQSFYTDVAAELCTPHQASERAEGAATARSNQQLMGLIWIDIWINRWVIDGLIDGLLNGFM